MKKLVFLPGESEEYRYDLYSGLKLSIPSPLIHDEVRGLSVSTLRRPDICTSRSRRNASRLYE